MDKRYNKTYDAQIFELFDFMHMNASQAYEYLREINCKVSHDLVYARYNAYKRGKFNPYASIK